SRWRRYNVRSIFLAVATTRFGPAPLLVSWSPSVAPLTVCRSEPTIGPSPGLDTIWVLSWGCPDFPPPRGPPTLRPRDFVWLWEARWVASRVLGVNVGKACWRFSTVRRPPNSCSGDRPWFPEE